LTGGFQYPLFIAQGPSALNTGLYYRPSILGHQYLTCQPKKQGKPKFFFNTRSREKTGVIDAKMGILRHKKMAVFVKLQNNVFCLKIVFLRERLQ
jgi:hypothetical protein